MPKFARRANGKQSKPDGCGTLREYARWAAGELIDADVDHDLSLIRDTGKKQKVKTGKLYPPYRKEPVYKPVTEAWSLHHYPVVKDVGRSHLLTTEGQVVFADTNTHAPSLDHKGEERMRLVPPMGEFLVRQSGLHAPAEWTDESDLRLITLPGADVSESGVKLPHAELVQEQVAITAQRIARLLHQNGVV